MPVHMIRMPDDERGWEPREIVWDSDAGTVAGEHSCVPRLRAWIDKIVSDGGEIHCVHGHWILRDPWREPGDFLRALRLELGEVCWDPSGLPAALRGVRPPPFVAYPLPPGAVA